MTTPSMILSSRVDLSMRNAPSGVISAYYFTIHPSGSYNHLSQIQYPYSKFLSQIQYFGQNAKILLGCHLL